MIPLATRLAVLVSFLLVLAPPTDAAVNEGVAGAGLDRLFPGARFDRSAPTQQQVTGVATAERPLLPDEILEYFRALDQASPRASLTTYARSHEGRELVYLAVGEPGILARLEEFRAEHASRLDPRVNTDPGSFDGVPAVAWMAYGIHGDELSSPDAAAVLAYWLVAGEDDRARTLRKNLVILIDPCENPDGRTRYLAQVTSFAHATATPDLEDLAHTSVWPWGRGNHYLFDLNRDWFSMVHPESARSEVIASWLPQLMVDSHEMGANDSYLFSPPRHPFNPFLPTGNRAWRERFGDDQASALDARGYPYYTAEWNEEFFPGYGSSWATYHGSVGILYEMSRTTGTLVRKREGTVRTFAQAVEHQVTSSVANLETLSANRRELLADHLLSRTEALESGRRGTVRCWILPFDARHPGRMEGLARLLRRQGIEVLRLAGGGSTASNARDARTGTTVPRLELGPGTILVAMDQPASRIARVLLNPHIPMEATFLREEREYLEKGKGSRLYDTTAWSLPLAYGLPAYWSGELPSGDWRPDDPAATVPEPPSGEFLSVVIDGSPDLSGAVLAELLQSGVRVRVAEKPFRIGDRSFEPGALVVRREGNPENLEDRLAGVVSEHGVELFPVTGSYAKEGPDLGGRHFKMLVAPRVGIWTGAHISPSSYGGLWHHLDLRLGLRFSGLDLARFPKTDLARYNVLVFPPANGGWETYRHALGDNGLDKLKRWIEAGGTAIGIDGGARFLADRDLALTKARFRSQALVEYPPAVYSLPLADVEEAGRLQSVGLQPRSSEAGGKGSSATARKSPYDVAPLIGPGAAPFTEGIDLGTPLETTPVRMADWLEPSLPPGKNGVDEKMLEKADKRLRSFMPRGAFLRVDLDGEFWMNRGLGDDATVWVSGEYALLAAEPVRTAARLADIPVLHRGGLLWPEAGGRLSRTAYTTREKVGRGQVILFLEDPVFRGWMHESRRMFTNAVLFGPGLGTDWSAPW